jgi:ABC-type nickel/cobalt efflux system permease component RcnA
MDKVLLAERKERYGWEIFTVVLLLIMTISNYGQESMLSLALGMAATKIISFVILGTLGWWSIYRVIGFLRLFRIKVDK